MRSDGEIGRESNTGYSVIREDWKQNSTNNKTKYENKTYKCRKAK
jgi:hypothetical protein